MALFLSIATLALAQTISLDQGFISCAIPWEATEVEKMHYCTTSKDYQFCQSLDEAGKKCFTFEEVTTGGNWVEFDLGDNKKQQIIFTNEAVFEENGEIVPFKENYSLSLKNNNFVFEWEKEGLALETELLFSIDGTSYTIAGLKVLAPEIEVKTFQENLSGGTKFWYEVQNVPEEIQDKLGYIKLTLKPVSGFSNSSIEKVEQEETSTFEAVLPEGISIDFGDLVNTTNFDLSFENNYTLIIKDKESSDGPWGETISLDPVFQSSSVAEDVHIYLAEGVKEVDSRAYFKFDISSIRSGATINSANLQLRINRDRSNDNYTFYHLDQNQGWTESDSVGNIFAMRRGTMLSTTGCYNAADVDLNCAITSVFQAAYNAGDSNFSFAMEDPDENSATPDTKSNGNNTFVGDVNAATDLKFDSSEGPVSPVLYVDYTESVPNAPTGFNVDANRLYAKKGGGGGMRLTWTDNSSNEAGFMVYRKQTDTIFVLVATTAANATSYDDLATGDNNTLFYKVASYNTAGDANTSVDSNISLDRKAPATPSLTLTYLGGSNVDANWVRVDDNSNSEIDNNILVYYRFDETSGSIAYNSATVDTNGTLTNGAASGSGKLGRGVEFFGSDDYVLVPSTLDMNAGSFTASVWVKPLLSNDHVILEQKNGTGTGRNILGIDADGSFCSNAAYSLTSSLGGAQICANTVIDQNVWQHITVTMNSGTLKFYKNGVQTNSLSAGTESNTGDYVLGVAKDLTGSDYNGLMDDFRLYNVALSAADVNLLYGKGKLRYDLYLGNTGQIGLSGDFPDNDTISLAGASPTSFSLVASLDDNATSYRITNASDTNSPQTPQAPTVTAIDSTTIDVNWSAVSDNSTEYIYKLNAIDFQSNDSNSSNTSVDANSGIAKYFVNCTSGGDCNSSRNNPTVDDYNTSVLGRHVTGLSPNTTYCFTVLATDGGDNNSSESSGSEDLTTNCATTPSVVTPGGGGPFCGDKTCAGSETCSTCPKDCGTCLNVCGNSVCDSGETSKNCPQDCSLGFAPVCGDGICSGGETSATCMNDCIEPPKYLEQAKKTCAEEAGDKCSLQEYCTGTWANATDSARCCTGACYGEPDLEVKANSSSKAEPGKDGYIAVTVSNKGSSTISDFKVELREVSDRKNKIVQSRQTGRLASNDRYSILFKIPFEKELSYSFAAFNITADPEYQLPETNRQNNTAIATMYFSDMEKCGNGTDDDLDGHVDESDGQEDCNVPNLFIKKATAFLPKTKDGELSSISFSTVVSNEFSQASGFYVNLHKDSLENGPIASVFIDTLEKLGEKQINFGYDYESGTGTALLQEKEATQQLGRFFVEIEYSGRETTTSDNSLEVTPDFSNNDLAIESADIPRVVVMGEDIVVTGKTINGRNGFPGYKISTLPKQAAEKTVLLADNPDLPADKTGDSTKVEIEGTYKLALLVDGETAGEKEIEFNSQEGFSFTIPASSLGVGSHVIKISTDHEKQVFEPNEENNVFSQETEVIDTIDKIYVFQRTINTEPLLVAFWAPKEAEESEYSFKLNDLIDLELEESITVDYLSNNKDLKIFRLAPTQIPRDSQNSIDVFRQPLGGEKTRVGETTKFERISRQFDRIFSESGVSLSEYLTGERFKRYYYFERLYLLSFLWWNKWKEE